MDHGGPRGGSGGAIRALAGAVLSTTLAGCSLFVSLDGLESSGAAAGDASIGDAGVDGSDSPADAAKGGSGYCATLSPKPLFCCDFDEDGGVGAGWDSVTIDPGAAASIDTSTSTSGTSSLLAQSTQANSSGISALLHKSFSNVGFTETHLAFDVHPDSAEYAYVGSIDLSGGFFVAVITPAPQIQISSSGTYPALTSGLPTGTWTRVYVDLVLPGSAAGSLTISFGDPAGTFKNVVLDHMTISDSAASGTASISTGLDNTTAVWQGHFDNVTFDLK
jgi:hypothetical protein